MKRILLVLLFLPILSNISAQNFSLLGLEIHNPAGYNPAFIGSDKMIQLDAVHYQTKYSHFSTWLSAMGRIPKHNSSFGLQFSKSSISGINSDAWSLLYAYEHSFSEDLTLKGGVDISGGITTLNSSNDTIWSKTALVIPGVYVEYKNWYGGFSIAIRAWYKEQIDHTLIPFYFNEERVPYANFVAGYNSASESFVSFSPLMGIQYLDVRSDFLSNLKFYVGGNLEFFNTVGLGFTWGNIISLTPSITICDRVTLFLSVCSYERSLLNYETFQSEYYARFAYPEIIGQLRIKI